MRPENKAMADFLASKGITGVVPKYIDKGSLRGCWRLCIKGPVRGIWKQWAMADAELLNGLGFVGFDGKPLGMYSGNGGMWQVFVRGHNELLG